MRSPTLWSRIAGAFALMIAMLAALAAAPGAAAQAGDSSITLHNRVCPTDYEGENWFEDCHDNPLDPGYTFTFTDGVTQEGTTNEDGDVGFANLPAGTYTITGGPPGDVTDYYVYCAVGTEGDPNQEQIPVNYVSGGIQIDLPADTNVLCDWYSIPISQNGQAPTPTPTETQPPEANDSSIEVHNRVCPADYEGENWFEDCHSNVPDPGLPFTFADGVTQEGTTNENGNVGFANLPAGTYTITGGAPSDVSDYYVFCSPENSQDPIPVDYVTGGIQFDLPADTNVVCDWYTIPQSQVGQTPTPTEPVDGDASIEVHNRICPEGYDGDTWYEDCHGNEPDPGLPFTFSNDVTREGETNENGNVGFANLPAGTYSITGGAPGEFTDNVVYCFLESNQEEVPTNDITGGVQLDLAAGNNVVCDWYTIPMSQNGQTPTATATEAPEQNNSSIEVHNRVCPEDYEGQNWFQDCHDNPAEPGLPFTFTDGVTQEGTTNENGNIGFANLPAGTYTITGGAPGEFSDYVVYCAVGTEAESNQEQVPIDYVTGGIQLDLAADTNIICDWYTIPLGQNGQTPTEEADQFDLPVYKLLCEDAPAEAAVSDFLTVGTVPDGCEQHEGTNVTVTDADGNEIGTCVTEADEPCYVTVTVGTTVYGTEDLNTVPEGYEPLDGETVEVSIEPATEASLLFVNVATQQTPTATAAPDMFDLPIYKLLCEDAPSDTAASDFVMMGTVPDGCEQFEGVTVTVNAEDGSELGSCVTQADEPCYVTVPIGSTVTATEDTSEVPEGYAPVNGDTIEYTIEPETEAWILFVNAAVQEEPTATDTPAQTPADTPATTPTTEPLPEGRTVHIASGTCDDTGEVVVELEDLRQPEGDPVGEEDAETAATSTSTIAMSLDELVGSDHVALAYSEDDTDATGDPVACAPIGGVINDAGELVIGLEEVDDSGYTGIAYLAPSPDDETQTDVSVFLAEDLAEDDPDSMSTPGV